MTAPISRAMGMATTNTHRTGASAFTIGLPWCRISVRNLHEEARTAWRRRPCKGGTALRQSRVLAGYPLMPPWSRGALRLSLSVPGEAAGKPAGPGPGPGAGAGAEVGAAGGSWEEENSTGRVRP